MNTRKRTAIGTGIGAGVVAVIAALLAVAYPVEQVRVPQPRAIDAAMTAWPMFAMRDADATQVVPPLRPTTDPLYAPGARYPLAQLCNLTFLNDVYTAPDTYDWSTVDQCFTDAAAFTVTLGSGTVISQPVILIVPPQIIVEDGDGSPGDPFNLRYIPAWITATRTFQTYPTAAPGVPVTYTYNAISYDAVFRTQITTLIAAAGARYNGNPQLLAVRVNPGYEEENQPHKPLAGEASNYFFSRSETVASCNNYLAYAWALGEAAVTAFPDHPVVLPSAVIPCYGSNSQKFVKGFWADTPTPQSAGLSMHSLVGDRADADEPAASIYALYKQLTAGNTLGAAGYPVLYEFAANPGGGYQTSNFGDDPWAYDYWALLAGMGGGGDFLVRNPNWSTYRNALDWRIQDRLQQDALWIVFRDLEYAALLYSTTGASGYRNDFARNGAVLTPTAFPQVCSQGLADGSDWRATVIARATTAYAGATPVAPVPCSYAALPTPKATFQPTPSPDPTSDFNLLQRLANRQARVLGNGKTLGVAASPTWARYGDTANITVTLTYLDIGTDTLALTVNEGSQTITKTNTGLWQVAAATFASVSITDADSCADPDGVGSFACFVSIVNDAGGVEYLHELIVDVADAVAPPPSPTPPPPSPTSPLPSPTSPPLPTISSITPISGTTAGGTSVDIAGSGLTGASVTFGGTAATCPIVLATNIYCTTPAHAAGAVNVVVTTAGGVVTSTNGFTYVVPPSPTPPPPSPTPPPPSATPPAPSPTSPPPTATATPTAAWVEQACPELAVTVDGDVSEWAGVTPFVLSRTSAAYLEPLLSTITTTAAYRCAWAGELLYLSGVITDSTLYGGSGNSGATYGDAAAIGIDGLGDGPNQPLVDDHDLLIKPDGRVLDFEVYPISHTLGFAGTAGGWLFELALDADTLGRPLGPGGIVGLIWGLLDATDGGYWDVQMVAPQRAGRLGD